MQARYERALLANQVVRSDRWGQPCLAYNVCVRPEPDATAALAALQESAPRPEPSLLRVPESALHVNILWLLPVHEEFGCPKDQLWQRHGPEWIATVARMAATTSRFRLRFRSLAATSSAVIAVADEPNQLSALRRELIPLLHLPGSASAGELAHTTLFRYAGHLRDPAALREWAADGECSVETDVSELLVIEERVYPSLEYAVIRRLPLAGAPAQ